MGKSKKKPITSRPIEQLPVLPKLNAVDLNLVMALAKMMADSSIAAYTSQMSQMQNSPLNPNALVNATAPMNVVSAIQPNFQVPSPISMDSRQQKMHLLKEKLLSKSRNSSTSPKRAIVKKRSQKKGVSHANAVNNESNINDNLQRLSQTPASLSPVFLNFDPRFIAPPLSAQHSDPSSSNDQRMILPNAFSPISAIFIPNGMNYGIPNFMQNRFPNATATTATSGFPNANSYFPFRVDSQNLTSPVLTSPLSAFFSNSPNIPSNPSSFAPLVYSPLEPNRLTNLDKQSSQNQLPIQESTNQLIIENNDADMDSV